MSKFHVNPASGEVGRCNATVQCPFGGEEVHAETREDATARYERLMENNTTPAPQKKSRQVSLMSVEDAEMLLRSGRIEDSPTTLKPSTAASLAEVRQAAPSAYESVELAEASILKAGAMGSAYLKATTDASQVELIGAILKKQAQGLRYVLGAKAAIEAGWEGPLDEHPAIPLLQTSREQVYEAGKLMGDRLSELWDKDARRYRDPAQTSLLHNLINVQLSALNKTSFAARDLARGL